ncbi:MAG: hypothetical protein RSB50_08570 [Cetobacterium sp.]
MKEEISIISCSGYGNTGSSVLTDLLSEFTECYSMTDYEFRFLQDYGGITTLEDCLVRSPHRLNSDIALKNFEKYVHKKTIFINRNGYEKFFNNKFKKYSNEYIEELIDVEWNGYWEQYQIESSLVKEYLYYKIWPRLKKIVSGKILNEVLPKRKMYYSNPKEKFYIATQKYLNKLFNEIYLKEKLTKIVFDQLIPPNDILRYKKYIKNLKVVVIDRDPRDLYIENMEKCKEPWLPKDINKFIKHYKLMRTGLDNDKECILRINFEEFIYNYDASIDKIINFLKLDKNNHENKKTFFNPEISKQNTKLWLKNPKYILEVKKIEIELKEYCYFF